MANPFKPSNSAVNKPKRNSFDLSFSNHLTFSIGQLIPAMCKEVLPGDTFKIDSALGLRFMPLAFPVQTKMRAHVHFFYQRTRNVWEDFEDFIYGNDKLLNSRKKLTHPYIMFNGDDDSLNENLLQTCSLGDYLGLPTVRYSSYRSETGGSVTFMNVASGLVYKYPYKNQITEGAPSSDNIGDLKNVTFEPAEVDTSSIDEDIYFYPNRNKYGMYLFKLNFEDALQKLDFSFEEGTYLHCEVDLPCGVQLDMNDVYFGSWEYNGSSDFGGSPLEVGSATAQRISLDTQVSGNDNTKFYTRVTFDLPVSKHNYNCIVGVISRFMTADTYNSFGKPSLRFSVNSSRLQDAVSSPTGSEIANPDSYKISALPFRVYESIYNAFYRDSRNNPLYVNGSPVYNQYCHNVGSGGDDFQYGIYNRNWELDQLTSAVQSPQQGVAPLVGISSTGQATFAFEGQEYTFDTVTADDADTITGVKVTENIPTPVARSIVNVATSGISINDFRNVNSYQRWLETNIRRGLKYKDQTLARWGVEPADSTLDMPEFIGGYSVDVDINTVTNVAQSSEAVLGDYAAQATAFGGSSHRINHYCDQHGFIMAIVSIVPAPVYTQLLPKMFLRESALDYYSPEFGQIGMQAIPYREVCPLELNIRANNSQNPPRPTDVFGYQRPWYEYIYSNDEAHGLFRTDFNQFLLSRSFAQPPTLGPDFLTVKESALNDVFSVHNRNNVLGMIRFNIEAQRPIPSVSVPSL